MATPPITKPIESPATVITDATCTFCGCVCDDIDITVKDNHITDAKRACVLGKSWFYGHAADDRPEKVRASFGENYGRLQQIKRTYDPTNLFRLNANIAP